MDLESIQIKARHDLTPDKVDRLEDRLYEINASRTGYEDAAVLGFLAEAQGELVGAVAGYTWGGICELRQVWVHETHRGEGLGEAPSSLASPIRWRREGLTSYRLSDGLTGGLLRLP